MNEKRRIFHVGSRDTIRILRDDILRMHGYEVESTLSLSAAVEQVSKSRYDLVLVDVEGQQKVGDAQQLCDDIKKVVPAQHVAFVCNHRVAIESDCPDDVIRAQFDPAALVRGVKEIVPQGRGE